MSKTGFVLALGLALAPVAPAQIPISLTGTIAEAPAGACNADATHAVACTEVLLKSSVVDLDALEGQTVELTGSLDLTPGCVTIDVASAAGAAHRTIQLAPFGTRLGRPVVLTSLVPTGSLIFYVFSGNAGFLPLGPLGTVFLDVGSSVFVGNEPSIGVSIRTETIPNDPGLVGVTVWYQFGYLSLLELDFGLLNPGCITIQR